MAFTTIVPWITGDVITATRFNTQYGDNINELRGGGLAISGQAARDFVYASTATQLSRLAAPSGFQVPRINPSGSGWEMWNPWQPRVTAITSSTTPTPNVDTTDCYDITALAAAAAFGNPTGTPSNFQKLLIRIKDNGTARALSWGSNYVAGGTALPTTTVISKILTIGFIYNTANSLNKFQCVAAQQEA